MVEDSGAEDEVESSGPRAARRWTMSPPCLAAPYCLPSGVPHRLRSQSPRVHTAPPSPMWPRRGAALPPAGPVDPAQQESPDQLRSAVQLAARSMESSTKDIKLLGERMTAATERMSEAVQDNSQALTLLSQVVDRLQALLAATAAETGGPDPAERDPTPKRSPKRPSPARSIPSLLSSSSSSSLGSSLDATSTSQGTSCLSVSLSPRTTPKTRRSPREKPTEHQAPARLLTNGLLDEAKLEARPNQQQKKRRRKKKKKKAT